MQVGAIARDRPNGTEQSVRFMTQPRLVQFNLCLHDYVEIGTPTFVHRLLPGSSARAVRDAGATS